MSQAIQYDLFGEIEAAEKIAESAARSSGLAASVFLAQTPWPGLIGWWLHPDAIESRTDGGVSYRSGPNDSPGWAWTRRRGGLLFESGTTWRGWDSRPRWCIPWAALRTLRAEHPDVTERLQALAAGRGHPCSLGWLWWTDPHALRPEGWHPSYLESERRADYYHGCSRPETAYKDRLDAWHLALDVVRGAALDVTKR